MPSESALPHDRSVFAALREHDVLVHHPYDSFTASIQRLVVYAAADPRVLAIKQTLYRTSGDSEIVDALIDAAEAGKQVVVVVEIKARGDERANIAWARKLEEAGCHVVYGFVGLKTHCKMVLVVREESDGSLRRFCHIGTGNYHPKTARLYEDFGLLTADRTVGEDITDLFNHLTGYSAGRRTTGGCWSPRPGCGAGLIEQIEAQADLARAGQPVADPDQVQRAHRRGHDRRAVPRVAGRRARRPVDARDLRAAARRARACRRTSGCAASSAGSWSTRGSTPSAPVSRTRRATSGSAAPT